MQQYSCLALILLCGQRAVQGRESLTQRLMNLTFSDLTRCMTIYLDDILVFSPTIEPHMLDLRAVFEKLRAEKLFAKRKKCFFG